MNQVGKPIAPLSLESDLDVEEADGFLHELPNSQHIRQWEPKKRRIYVAIGLGVVLFTLYHSSGGSIRSFTHHAPPTLPASISSPHSRRVKGLTKVLGPLVDSYHEEALSWLSNEDTWGDPSDTSIANYRDIWISRYVMTVVYYEFHKQVATVPEDRNWLVPTKSICEWRQVKPQLCGIGSSPHVATNLYYRTVRSRYGAIPSEIGLLTTLTGLTFQYAINEGTMPTEIGKLTGLVQLDIEQNMMSGPIPSEIGRLKTMTDLKLDLNGLTGSLPTEICGLTRLTALDLGYNALEQSIPTVIGLLTALESLDLSHNGFGGRIPTQIAQISNLKALLLSDDDLTGPFPAEIGSMKALTYLKLDTNQLTGKIPTLEPPGGRFQYCDLSRNNFKIENYVRNDNCQL